MKAHDAWLWLLSGSILLLPGAGACGVSDLKVTERSDASRGGAAGSGGGGASGKAGANVGGDEGSVGGSGAEAGLGGDTGAGAMMSAGNGGEGGGEGCTESETRCAVTGEPEKCMDSVWTSLGACDVETPVCYQGACVVCAPGTFRCVGQELDQCDAGSWQMLETCGVGAPVCNALAGICSNLTVRGGLTTLGVDPSPSPSFIVRGELSLQPTRVCDSGADLCIQGGIVP